MELREHPAIRPSKLRRFVYDMARRAVAIFVRLLAPRFRVSGLDNLPHSGAFILAPNHLSHIDSVLVACAVKRPLWIMAMREIFDSRIMGAVARFFQAFPIERGSADREALTFATRLLQNGQIVVLFPEGHLSETGQLEPILPGAALLALRAGVPIIPVGISGSPKLVPYGMNWPRFTLAPVCLQLGKPIFLHDLKALPKHTARELATDRLESAIHQAVVDAQSGVEKKNDRKSGSPFATTHL